jgi:hypothetical protein
MEAKAWPEKFDVIVSNPPYSKQLHLRFLLKATELNKGEILFVHPSFWLVDQRVRPNKKWRDIKTGLSPFIKSIEIFNGNPVFGIGLFYPCVITHLGHVPSDTTIQYRNRINGIEARLTKEEFEALTIFGPVPEYFSFREKITNWLENNPSLQDYPRFRYLNGRGGEKIWRSMGKPLEEDTMVEFTQLHGHSENSYTIFSQKKGNVGTDNMVEFTWINGNHDDISHSVMWKPDFFTWFGRNTAPKQKPFTECKYAFCFMMPQGQAENLIKFLKTDFARTCLALNKYDAKIESWYFSQIPLLDLKKEWTDSDLYALFNISSAEQNFIKKIIPPYYD